MSGGLLIVNADDWGGFAAGTDAILQALQAGAITSTTAMVFMADSERAAEVAREHGVPTGLHLNLTEPLTGPEVPAAVRATHDRLRAHFADLGRRRWRYSPGVRAAVTAAVGAQLDEYRRLYGHDPLHVDSHHHVHVCPDVFLSRALPRGTRVRQTRSAPPAGGLSAPAAAARRAKHAALAARFTTTDRFWAISDLHPDLGGEGFAGATALAASRPVEVMVHPSFEDELGLLLRDDWLRFVAAPPRRDSYAGL